ncbi:MAG: hypothetical protein FJ098_11285, partial [Deltaproteobacteria bacterium]|nr:hypothetical protein [Deltaproteobacteria bacterium]
EEVRTLVFQPNQDDVDWSYTFGLEVVVPEHGYQKTVKDFLKISVTGAASGAGPACLLSKEPFSAATAHYRGTMTGTTDPGGDFTYEHPMEGTGNPSALLYQALDGSPWVNLYVSQQPGNGTVMITFPLPGPPQGGVTQVITHPGQIMGTNDFPDAAMWGYMCLLPDGRLFDFSRFDSFDGTAHVTPTEDCSGLVIELQQTDTNWDEKNQDWVSCTYTGTFTGTWCDPMESPGSGCAY